VHGEIVGERGEIEPITAEGYEPKAAIDTIGEGKFHVRCPFRSTHANILHVARGKVKWDVDVLIVDC
jgi:hypothetical protein